MKHGLVIVAGALSLAACAGTSAGGDAGDGNRPANPSSGERCESEPTQQFVGQRATAEVGAAILAATGATQMRWVPPRSAVTMDYRHDRVTVSYDDDYRIIRASCG